MASVTFNNFEISREYNREDPGDMRLSIRKAKQVKKFDGPNPSSVAFAELVEDYFNRGWSTSCDLLILYGEEYVEKNTIEFLKIFDRAFEVLESGKKYGLIGDSSGLAVKNTPDCILRFHECYSEFYDACVEAGAEIC
mgnify:CR=1 FL=1